MNLLPEPENQQPVLISDMDEFVMKLDGWHAKKVEQANRMLEIPEGTEVEIMDADTNAPITLTLSGNVLIAYRVGVSTALELFNSLPFSATVEDAPDAS